MRPVFADPKADVIFKKIFGEQSRKALLIALLESLLELDGPRRIVDIEYLSPEQLPLHQDLKLSILDVKCTDARGTRYVVEMQVIEVEGFEKRVVYNACKAYSSQLGNAQNYPSLNDVIAVTVCDFVLWPDQQGSPAVPLLSHWRMAEQHSGATGLPQLQYVFLELPKYAAGDLPKTTVEKWAYFFRETRYLKGVPDVLSQAPYATALEVARVANMTEAEGTAYERQEMAIQDFRGGLSLAERRGEERGVRRGVERGKQLGIEEGKQLGIEEGKQLALLEARRAAIRDFCDLVCLALTPEQERELATLDADGLERLRQHLKAARAWPADPAT